MKLRRCGSSAHPGRARRASGRPPPRSRARARSTRPPPTCSRWNSLCGSALAAATRASAASVVSTASRCSLATRAYRRRSTSPSVTPARGDGGPGLTGRGWCSGGTKVRQPPAARGHMHQLHPQQWHRAACGHRGAVRCAGGACLCRCARPGCWRCTAPIPPPAAAAAAGTASPLPARAWASMQTWAAVARIWREATGAGRALSVRRGRAGSAPCGRRSMARLRALPCGHADACCCDPMPLLMPQSSSRHSAAGRSSRGQARAPMATVLAPGSVNASRYMLSEVSNV
jgi:hypothetical protein